jgi:hypothetical protein
MTNGKRFMAKALYEQDVRNYRKSIAVDAREAVWIRQYGGKVRPQPPADERTIEEGKEEEMYYTVECNTCGQKITGNLLASDFSRPGLINGPESYQNDLATHNMTHLEEVGK